MTSSSCKKEESVVDPSFNIEKTIDGLEVNIHATANNAKEIISNVIVKWGDGTSTKILEDDFSKIDLDHSYSNPGNYEITISIYTKDNKQIDQNASVIVDFNETSLENIKPELFKTSEKEYLILTINLHTYQEKQQNEKFNLITDLIGKMDVDFIVFQECAQNKNSTIVEGKIREDNMALIISKQLKEKYNIDYNYVWDWAHYGWSVWEEGIAILSKHQLIETDERYISSNTSTENITSRKAIYGSYQLQNKKINFFSTHTHWRTSTTDEEHNNQIRNIKLMAKEKENINPDAITFICGDFNVNPTSDYPWSEGYNTMMLNNEYVDTFLDVYTDANNKPAQSKYNTIGGDYPGRIDYIFMKNNSDFEVTESQIIFTEDVVGRVSDHFGVLTKITETNR